MYFNPTNTTSTSWAHLLIFLLELAPCMWGISWRMKQSTLGHMPGAGWGAFNLHNKPQLKFQQQMSKGSAHSSHNQLSVIGTVWSADVHTTPSSSEKWACSIWSGNNSHNVACLSMKHAPLTMDIDLPEPRHFVLLSSRTAGLQERLQERLDERLGMGCGGPSLELCTASYRLSIDPSYVDGHTHTYLLDSWNVESGVIYEWI